MSMRNGVEAGLRDDEGQKGQKPEYSGILGRIEEIEKELNFRRELLEFNRGSVRLREEALDEYLAKGNKLEDWEKERDHFLLNPAFLEYFRGRVAVLEEKIEALEQELEKLMALKEAQILDFQAAARIGITRSVRKRIADSQPEEVKRSTEDRCQQSSPSDRPHFSGVATDSAR